MSDIDNDLQQRLKRFSEEIQPQPGRGAQIVRAARGRRRLVALGAGFMTIVLIGGVAGAASLLGDRKDLDPAPQPDETSGCVSVGYDLAVAVPKGATNEEVSALKARLREDERVVKISFVTAEDATRTYLAENPSHEGPVPSAHAVDQFRLDLVEGLDSHDQRLMREFAAIGSGAYAPALRCPPRKTQQKFARYFFEVHEGNTSASGTLEVDWSERELCLEVQTRNIKASHLLFMDSGTDFPEHVDGAVTSPSIVFTFFEPSSEKIDADLPPTGTHCFSGDQLEELDGELLAELVDSPERFRVDFHRGPDDEPGLVAELFAQRMSSDCEDQPPPKVVKDQVLAFYPATGPAEESTGLLPIRFPDGSTAELVYPPQLQLEDLYAKPDLVGGVSNALIRPVISYGGIPFDAPGPFGCLEEAKGGLVPVWGKNGRIFIVLTFEEWHVTVFDRQTRLAVWAEHLRGQVDENGWLQLSGSGDLKLGPEFNPGDSNLIFADDDDILSLWPLACGPGEGPPPEVREGARSISFCVDNVEIHAQGKPGFVEAVAEGLRVRNLETRFPLDHYEIIP